jgi:DNA invertase Pin-like site-specific DNA recombinase
VTKREATDRRAERASGGPIRAAQYVRMSTEHQKYSTANQSDAILRYAQQRGFTLVRTYEDEGKSGLRLDGRDALKRLISDVRSGNVDFSAVLVYDVSRWGRFQDADESAYYEFICKEAGISVHYCAEQFENDGSLSATIIKGMKRAMAGEYSRELSAKVFAGQCRLISLGFRQGGTAGFGLRRQLIDERHEPKGQLSIGLRKSLQTDRVVLIPGPDEEIALVRRIYELFHEGRSEREIAELLNEEGHITDLGRRWTRGTVHRVLTNEKYIGNNVYNRTSFKLKAKRISNPPDMWVRANGAFPPIVDAGIFLAVQRVIEERSRRLSDGDMLERLASLLRERGWLSGLIIDERDDMPSTSCYRSRFGSLLRAYERVGYTPARDYGYLAINRTLRRMHPDIVASTMAAIQRVGGTIRRDPATDLLTVNDEFTTSIVLSRCQQTARGSYRWTIRFDASLRPDISVGVRMDHGNADVLDYYLLPRIDIEAPVLRLGEDNGTRLDSYRTDSLESFFHLAARTPLGAVA